MRIDQNVMAETREKVILEVEIDKKEAKKQSDDLTTSIRKGT